MKREKLDEAGTAGVKMRFCLYGNCRFNNEWKKQATFTILMVDILSILQEGEIQDVDSRKGNRLGD